MAQITDNYSNSNTFDLCIVGSGIAGSSIFYHAKQNNQKVLLIEKFELFHSKGSSHGESRIIRLAYNDPVYSEMSEESLSMWKELKNYQDFFKQTGGLDIGHENELTVNQVINVVKERNISHEILKSNEIRERFPLFKNIPDHHVAVYQPQAGILNPKKIKEKLLLSESINNNTTILQKMNITKIVELDDGSFQLFVKPNNQNQDSELQEKEETIYHTKKLIICVGAYTKHFLKQHFNLNIKFEVWRMSYVFWKLKQKDTKQQPVWIFWGNDPFIKDENLNLGYYGFPEYEKEGFIKSALHHMYLNEERDIDPEERAKLIDLNQEWKVPKKKIEVIQTFLRSVSSVNKENKIDNTDYLELNESYEDLINEEGRIVTCLYEMTPTEDFIIDYIPTKSGKKNCVIFGGGSGHGFKFGILLGKMLLDLLEENNNDLILGKYPREKFSLNNVLIN
ncbi:hypothetical protein ABK040_014494 [Willaertia magna]